MEEQSRGGPHPSWTRWIRHAWTLLAACAFIVLTAAVVFRIDGLVTLEHDALLTFIYGAMLVAVPLGLLCIAFLATAYVIRSLRKTGGNAGR